MERMAVTGAAAALCRHGGSPTTDCGYCRTRHLAFCAALEPHELSEIEAIVGQVHAPAGTEIFMEGDPADHVFNVTSGAVRLYKLLADGRRQIVGFLLPGDFMGLAVRRTYAYGAETLIPTDLCRFRASDLRALFRAHPKVERRLLEMTGDELAAAQEQMMLLGRKTPVERLSTFLLDLGRRSRRWGGSDNPLHLPMSRTDIADYLGLTIETVSRTFTRLRRDGIVDLPETQIVQVRDRTALERLAAGEAE